MSDSPSEPSRPADDVPAGPRVLLRAPCAADAEEFVRVVVESRAFHHPWAAPADTPERFAAYLGRTSATDFAAYLVRSREDGVIVGAFNVRYAGRGLMSDALSLVLDDAFGRLELHRLEANIQPGNTASKRLVLRAGFRLEGFSPRYLMVDGAWRDHERWAICAEDREVARVAAVRPDAVDRTRER